MNSDNILQNAQEDAAPKPPVLTFPEDVANFVREHYSRSDVILEYGSGGSTVLAAQMTGKTVFSVESDRAWAENMELVLRSHSPNAKAYIHYVNIGPTKEWGKPKSDAKWRSYPDYALTVWQRPDFVHPDLVLIDGRFRSACFATCLMSVKTETTVLFDDYAGRSYGRTVEKWLKPIETCGRMAKFVIRPGIFDLTDFNELVRLFYQPN